jgi:hypothetical protein
VVWYVARSVARLAAQKSATRYFVLSLAAFFTRVFSAARRLCFFFIISAAAFKENTCRRFFVRLLIVLFAGHFYFSRPPGARSSHTVSRYLSRPALRVHRRRAAFRVGFYWCGKCPFIFAV